MKHRSLARFVMSLLTLTTLVALAPAARGAAGPKVEDGWLESFDGTPIAYTIFLPAGASAEMPVPVVLMGNAPNDAGRTRTLVGLVDALVAGRYAVLTWDTRGSGDSGGEASFNALDVEVRDTRLLLDMVARRPEIQKDAPGDPRSGMVGSTYAGTIQLMTAAVDSRLDAIVPRSAWNDIDEAFRPGGVLKATWLALGYSLSVGYSAALGIDSPSGPQTGAVDQHLHQALAEAVALNDWSADTVAWWDARSPQKVINGTRGVPGVRVPTLILQGVNDPLFAMNQGVANYQQLKANRVPAKMVVYCYAVPLRPAGHSCIQPPDQEERLTRTTLAWLDRYVRDPLGDTDTGAAIEYQLQDGTLVPHPGMGRPRAAGSGSGMLVHTVAPTSGAVTAPQPSSTGFRVPLTAPAGSTLFGTPRASVEVSGMGEEAFLFFKILDIDAAGTTVIVDDQVTARRVRSLSDTPQKLTIELGGVAWRVAAGHHLALEVATTSNDHTTSRVPSTAEVRVTVDLPFC